jgi:hypothetical protein
MKRSIKVIAEMGQSEHKALLLEMPQEMIDGLKVYADGTVDTKCLLGMLMMMEQEAALEAEEDAMGQLDMLLNIYDDSLAADFNHSVLSS